ncbi:sensor histidine kinase [Kibdelosporangium phytohabitans]|uniref:histidine kinase n=1 Tax=Kibdelosporangium phytohabitans TaxID=860235 RepID=A0A0N9IG29_9PSEU|nr:histidine kinase [Kibdelosporangium phytohabitans]ALG13853.1 histidine kinase [Kibdelosporangium phytohabitans]MBE1467217.1 signal transduction histidine kinase [Kibdelosporangium phytohabitans]
MKRRRSVRDWLVDTTLFLFAALLGVLAVNDRFNGSVPMPDPAWLFQVDQVLGLLACCTVWIRKRWPVEIALILLAVSTFSELTAGGMLVVLFTVAVHRPPRISLPVFALSLASTTVYMYVRPETGDTQTLLILALTIQGIVQAWGLVVYHRRQLIISLRDRADRAETEAQLRAHQVREEIAREMHDVLGHRLSLLSVHAGALEYNPAAPTDDIARAAQVIRESAHQALQDLREVIGVLRAPVGELPQPTMADVATLVTESRRAGMNVRLRQELSGTVPELLGRTSYRIVQEGLTNARKHAPGADVRVVLTGEPADGLTVEVVNTLVTPAGENTDGQGLKGLGERVALADGRFEHGPTTEGWRLRAWLPWPA